MLQRIKALRLVGLPRQGWRTVVSGQKTVVNFLLVYLLLFVSGTWRYMQADNKFLVIGFLVTLGAWFVFSDRKINDRFLLYTIVFSGFLVLLGLYTGGSLSLPSVIASTMKIVLAYLVVRTVGENFVNTYVKVIVFLAAISLFGYLTDILNLGDAVVVKLPPVGTMGYEGVFYLFRCRWHPDRNNGIFYEPGAYQAFLNAGLFLLLFQKTNFTKKKTWVYIGILATTLITTFSTTGLLLFASMLLMFILKSELVSGSGKITIISIVFVLAAVLSAQFYSAVVVKLNDYFEANEYELGTSGKARSADAGTDMKLFKRYVFGLGNEKYTEQFGVVGRFDEGRSAPGSSNGVTRALAELGLPFSLFLFGSYYWALKRLLYDSLLTVGAFVMVLLFLASESYYLFSPFPFLLIVSAFVYRGTPESRLSEQVGDIPQR